MENHRRKLNIDKGLRGEKGKEVFPPTALEIDSKASSRGQSQWRKVTPNKIQRPPKPPQQSATKQQILQGLNAKKGAAVERRPGQVHYDSPWSSYKKMVYLDSDSCVIGARSIKQHVARIIVRVSPRLDTDRILQLLDIRHKHIVQILEAFQDTDTFLVYETMHISLDVLIGCGEKFKESQIARICLEVSVLFDNGLVTLTVKLLLAIVNLTSKGLQHGNIIPSNVLFTYDGVAKLGAYCPDSP